jgi:hypothetical protein
MTKEDYSLSKEEKKTIREENKLFRKQVMSKGKKKKAKIRQGKPTELQRNYLKELQKNALKTEPLNKGELLQLSGYSALSATNPAQVENTEGFQALLKKYLPEDKLLETAKKGLNSTKLVVTKEGSITVEDWTNRHRFAELGFKLHGKIKGSEDSNLQLTQVNIYWGDGTT